MVASVVEHSFARAPQPAPVAEASESTFRAAMRELARGVCVVTFGAGNNRTGFTATSVTSLSADPPSLLACLHRSSSSYGAVRRSLSFAVNLLSADQQEYAELFAGRSGLQGSERYQGGPWRPLPSGVLCLANSIAAFDCEIEDRSRGTRTPSSLAASGTSSLARDRGLSSIGGAIMIRSAGATIKSRVRRAVRRSAPNRRRSTSTSQDRAGGLRGRA